MPIEERGGSEEWEKVHPHLRNLTTPLKRGGEQALENSWFETVSGMGKSRGIVGGSGNVTLSADLTQVRIWFYATTSPYTTNFSQGTIRLSWEY